MTPEKAENAVKIMTDNEIIKAYGCCNLSDLGGCDECPCKQEGECIIPTKGFDLEREVYSVLNRQKAEIERLQKQVELGNEEIELLTKIFNDRTAELQTAKLDIKQLHIDVERIENRRIKDCRSWQSKYSSLRSEAFKEFAKLLIDKAENGVISIANLPEYVKEMVSDAK